MMQQNLKVPKTSDTPATPDEVPTQRKAIVHLRYERENVSNNTTNAKVQSAIRAAEAGDTRELFALYRDLTVSGSHIQTEFNKRKLSMLSQTSSVLPEDKDNKDDVEAATACRQMISDCENWLDGLIHQMDSVLWPVSVVEKIFRKGDMVTRPGKVPLMWTLKRFEPVKAEVLCFQQPWLYNADSQIKIDPNGWEPDLRFYNTDQDGRLLWDYSQTYAAIPIRHIIHRGHLLVSVRDNWGGPMRAVLFWWLLGALGRDWFGRYMERFASPFAVAKTDSTNNEAVESLKSALSLSTKIGGLVVDHETEVELVQAASSDGATAYEKFLGVCNKEISKLIVGQTLSTDAQSTGLGSSVGNLQGDVREDFRVFDQIKLGETLRQQLFKPFLEMNGLRGAAPRIVWGGMSVEEAKGLADVLVALNQAQLEPTDESIPTLSDRLGFQIQRKAMPDPIATGGAAAALKALSASIPSLGHPSDRIVDARAKALGQAYRGSMAPFRQIVLSSNSREECLKNLEAFYPDWNPTRLAAEMENALQICGAAGAAAGSEKG